MATNRPKHEAAKTASTKTKATPGGVAGKRIVLAPFGVDAGPMTEVEAALDDLEASWADFAYAIRPNSMARVVRRLGGPASIRMDSLGQVHAVLEHYRGKLSSGDRSAIFDALTHCAEENVPMPYWVSAALIEIARELHHAPKLGAQPKSLHSLFGMDARFPTSATKAIKAKRDLQLRGQLWWTACTIMGDNPGISKDAAVKKACAELRFPYSHRKALQLFDLQNKIQREFLDARGEGRRSGRVTHRIR